LNLEHIGTGDLLRAAIREHTPVGERAKEFVESGQLVPDQVVNDLVAERFAREDRPLRFMMDGYPRTQPQAMAFDAELCKYALPVNGVLLLDVPDQHIIARLSGRWSCPKTGCKATYHTTSNPPKVMGICDDCGTELVQRADDHEETVKARLVIYHEDTARLIPYYREKGLLAELDGRGEIEEVYRRLAEVLHS
jgi:adenylate kinase